MRSTLDNTIRLVATRYLVLPLSVVTGILMARTLGPAELGKYAVMIWLPSVLAGPMSLGLGNANLYIAARKPEVGNALFTNSLIVSAGFSAVVLSTLLVVPEVMNRHLPLDLSVYHFLIPLLDLPFRLLNVFVLNLFNAWQDHWAYRIAEAAQTVFYFVFCIIGVFVFDLTLWAFVYAQIIANVCANLVAIYLLRRHISLHLTFDYALLIESIRYGMKVQMGSMIRVGGQKLDELMVAYFAGPYALGLMTLARNITNRIRIIPYSLAIVLAPKLAHDTSAAAELAAETARRLSVVLICIALGCMVAAVPLIPLIYGDAFRDAVGPLQLMLLLLVPIGSQRIMTTFLLAQGATRSFLMSVLAGSATIILMDIMLIPKFGIYGAVIASIVGMTVEVLYLCRIMIRQSEVTWQAVLVPTGADLGYLWRKVRDKCCSRWCR